MYVDQRRALLNNKANYRVESAPDLEQFELLPLQVVQTFPRSHELGQDSLGWCTASDRKEYLAKTSRHRNDLPMTEWLCTHLYTACGIKTAPCRVLLWPDKDVVFGSRRLGNSLTQAPGIELSTKFIDAMGAELLWKILILDWFVGNFDRRDAQFACFHDADQKPTARPIDFSRATILREIHSLPDPFAGKTDLATYQFAAYIYSRFGRTVEVEAVETTLFELSRVSADSISSWIQLAPQEWVVPHLTAALVDFWMNTVYVERS